MEPRKTESSQLTVEQKIKGIVFSLGALLLIWIFFIPSCSDEKEKKTYKEVDALFSSRQFVEQRLKSPSTAEFCYSTDQTKRVNDTTFLVTSYVDSQNGFGAMLRTNYSCKITFIPSTDRVQVDDLIME